MSISSTWAYIQKHLSFGLGLNKIFMKLVPWGDRTGNDLLYYFPRPGEAGSSLAKPQEPKIGRQAFKITICFQMGSFDSFSGFEPGGELGSHFRLFAIITRGKN